MKANVSKALETNNSKKIAGIDKLLEDLQVELLKKAQAKQPFDDITEQIESLRRQKREMQLEDANRQAGVTHVYEMDTFLDELDTKVTEYDEALVRRFIERITVYDKHCKVTFKARAEINIKM